jgi:isoleucyl-tRNA synthetase
MGQSKKSIFSPLPSNPDFPGMEQELLDHWYKTGLVDKYLHKNDSSSKKFFFQDGPITANNPMGVHHAWGRTYKDLFQRYKNMQGFRQRFQNGFDCQGLWVEVEVEKELGFKNKKDIEEYGVDKFVNSCKDRVYKFSGIQTEQSKRLGYFMDWDNSYFTMSEENNYMIWHFLKVCASKGFIYQGHDAVPWCPRCETAISQHEMLTADYKQATHDSVFLELPLVDRDREFIIIWTTTPWTIPGNVAVAIDKNIDYSQVLGVTGDKFWVANDLVEKVFEKDHQGILKTVKGSELVGLKYEAPFDNLPVAKIAAKKQGFHTIVATDSLILPIDTVEGTGLVHLATGAGTEDHHLAKKLGLPVIPVINDKAEYLKNFGDFSGLNAKRKPKIILDHLRELDSKGHDCVFKIAPYTHRYPACWRCKEELVWKLADEWYIAMDKVDPEDKQGRTLRQKMIDVTKKINWIPGFGLDRELDWLTNMHDWLISKKNRYWGLALPIWICKKCKKFEVVGSREELEKRAISGWKEFDGHTPHKPHIDAVKIKCSCGEKMSRIPDVGNPWLDAGIVPFSTLIDPETGKLSYTSKNRDYWKFWFPANFITESFPGQFKNWFYSMIAMGTLLEDTPPFENVLGFASMLGEDGREMHKSWGNSIEFNEAAEKIGADIMRWVFVRHNPERNLLFGFKVTDEVRRRFHLILWNSYRFFANAALLDNWTPPQKIVFPKSKKPLDLWILSRLNQTILKSEKSLDKFDPSTAALSLEGFVSDLSTWYIRRSRDRISPSAVDKEDKNTCFSVLYYTFHLLSRALMPFTPFTSEKIYTNLTGEVSVNLTDWPKTDKIAVDKDLELDMNLVRKVCELGHAQRKNENIPVRQALSKMTILGVKINKELYPIIEDELNVEAVECKKGKEVAVILDTKMTPHLLNKGESRNIIRAVQQERKDQNCDLDQKINLALSDWPEEFEDEIKQKTLAEKITKGDKLSIQKI